MALLLVFLASAPHALAAAAESAKEEQSPVVGLDATGAIRPVTAATTWYAGSTFGFGMAYDVLTNRSEDRFRVPGAQFALSYGESIRGPWSGQLQIVLGEWETRLENPEAFPEEEKPPAELTALRIMSAVELSPLGKQVTSSPVTALNAYLRPVLFAGPGFLTFFRNEDLIPDRVEGLSGEAALRWGVGLRAIVPGTMAVYLSFEKWRGVKTFDFTAQALTLSFELGDVDVR